MAFGNPHKYMVCTVIERQKVDLKNCCCTIMKGNENRNTKNTKKKQTEHENKLKINKAEHLGKHAKIK